MFTLNQGENARKSINTDHKTSMPVAPENKEKDLSNIPLSIRAAGDHSLMLDAQGRLWGWGDVDDNNKLTSPTLFDHFRDLADAKAVTGYRGYNLVLKKDGTVWGWGYNRYGQLGDRTYISRVKPVQVLGLENIQCIDSTSATSIALSQDGHVWAWGDTSYGQLGIDRENGEVAAIVPGLKEIVKIATSGFGNLALRKDGTVWAWGYGPQLDLNTGNGQAEPAQVQGLVDIIDISGDGQELLALKKDGTVWGWGDGGAPRQIEELTNITTIEQGLSNGYAIDEEQKLWEWGFERKPQQVPVPNIILVSSEDDHTIAVDINGDVWTWGDNAFGQLGDGTTNSREVPAKISFNDSSTIESKYTESDVFSIEENNIRVSFSLEFPDSWKDKYLLEQHETEVRVYQNTTHEDPANIVSIYGVSPEMWEESIDHVYPWIKLGEINGLVVVGDYLDTYYPIDYIYEEEINMMLRDIEQIKMKSE